jgi:hypothetical protein
MKDSKEINIYLPLRYAIPSAIAGMLIAFFIMERFMG